VTGVAPGQKPSRFQRLGTAPAPAFMAGLAFLLLFWEPLRTLLRDWWSDPDAGHGLLLGPLAVYLAWKRGSVPSPRAQPGWGLAILAAAVLLRYLSGLAAELFTMRSALLLAVAGLIVFNRGVRQLLHWWLPVVLLALSIPIPTVILNTVAFPLQLKASEIGASLLELRRVPVTLAGNVLHLPGRSLFVTEACSGLRSLTALLSLGVLIGGLWLRSWWSRAAVLALSIPVAVVLNSFRVFLTGFLVYYVSPAMAEGFMHYTQGWVLFVVAFLLLGGIAWVSSKLERRLLGSAGIA
jgi:exosortase